MHRRFPDELLLEFFNHIYLPCKYRQPFSEKSGGNVRAVCRRWYELIWATPRYWCLIHVYRRSEWLALCLSRAASSPTLVDIHFNDSHLPGIHLLLQAEYTPIVRSLVFLLGSSATPLEDLLRLLSTSLPNLEHLSFSFTPFGYYHSFSSKLPIPWHLIPNVQELAFSSVSFPRGFSQYRNLRVLKLSAWWDNDITFDELLDLLETCKHIEELTLSGVLRSDASQPEHIDEPLRRPQIVLPQLYGLSLAHYHEYFRNRHILSHLCLPAITSLEVTDDVSHFRRREFLDELGTDTFSPLLPADHSAILPFLPTLTEVKLSAFGWDDAELSGCNLASGASFRLALSRQDSQDQPTWSPLAGSCLGSLARIVSEIPHVTRMHLSVDFGRLLEQGLQPIFHATPHLEELLLTGSGNLDCVFNALSPWEFSSRLAATSPCVDVEAAMASAPPSATLLPRLEYMHIGDTESRFHDVDAILGGVRDILRLRAAAGLRLERLALCLMHKTEEQYRKSRETWLPQLGELVRNVSYTHREFEESERDWQEEMEWWQEGGYS